MANQTYYPAHEWWKSSLEDNFEIMLNPLLDDLGRRITLLDLASYMEDTLPFISEIITDGTSITGSGTIGDPLTAVGAGGDTNFANTDLTFEGSRFHEGDANDLYFHGFERFQIYTQTDVALRKGTDLTFWDNGDLNSITFSLKSPLPESTTYYLPPVDGTDGQVLTTNGIGDLTWEDASGGGIANNLFTSDLTLAANRLHDLSTFNFNIGRATDTYHPLSLNTTNSYLGFGTSKIQIGNGLSDIVFSDNSYRFNNKGFHIFAHATDGALGINLYNNTNTFKVSHFSIGNLAADTDYIWNEDGTSGQFLTTDGFGNLTWGNSVINITGYSVDNTDPINPVVKAIPTAGTNPAEPVTGDIEIEDGFKIFPTIGGGSYYVGDPAACALSVGLVDLEFASDIISWEGVKYRNDYSANFVDRSLVDKAYVNNLLIDYVPLIGTTAGFPITGDIEITDTFKIFSDNGAGEASNVLFETGYLKLYQEDNTGPNKAEISLHKYYMDFNVTIGGDATHGFKFDTIVGLTYNLDYSSGYTNRSLVDKEYVDNLSITHGDVIRTGSVIPASSTRYGVLGLSGLSTGLAVSIASEADYTTFKVFISTAQPGTGSLTVKRNFYDMAGVLTDTQTLVIPAGSAVGIYSYSGASVNTTGLNRSHAFEIINASTSSSANVNSIESIYVQ